MGEELERAKKLASIMKAEGGSDMIGPNAIVTLCDALKAETERKLENDYCDDCIICVTHYQKSFKQERDILAKTVDELRGALRKCANPRMSDADYAIYEKAISPTNQKARDK